MDEQTPTPTSGPCGNPVIQESLKPCTASHSSVQATAATSTGETTLVYLFGKYVDALTAENKSPKTIEGYAASFKLCCRFLQQTGLAANLASFTRDTVTDYVLFQKNKAKYTGHPTIAAKGVTVSISTINVHLRFLKAFSSWLYREGHKPTNELQGYRLPRAPKRLFQPLTAEEKSNLLRSFNLDSHIGFRNYAAVIVLLDTGLRATEVSLIKLSDINWNRGSIVVLGKGNKERTVGLNDTARRAVQEYIARHRDKAGRVGTDRLFLTKTGKPITLNTVRLLFTKLKKSTGITRLHAHLCRHTFATDFLHISKDTMALQQILGHSSIAMVQRYVHFNNAQIVEQHHRFSPVDHFYSAQGSETTDTRQQPDIQADDRSAGAGKRFMHAQQDWQ